MRLVKWEPLQEVATIQNQIDRMFTDFWKDPKGLDFHPPVDVLENKDEYIVKADLAGIKKEDIDISINNNVLTLKAQKNEIKEDGDYNYHRKERVYGSFQKQVSFASNVDTDNIKAKYTDGVIELVIPKIDKEKAKKIVIE